MEPLAIPFAFPGAPRVRCLFLTRRGGVSAPPFDGANISFDVGDNPEAVRANRLALQREWGFGRWLETRQVHGDALRFEPEPVPDDACDGGSDGLGRPGLVEADGQATSRPGDALVVKTADCQPLLLTHETGRFVAGLHVGWRGNRMGFIQSAIARLCARYAARPSELFAARGPSLGPGASEFTNFDTEFGEAFEQWFDRDAMRLDLWRLTWAQLTQAGVPPEHIFSVDCCTRSLPEWFFSYRGARRTGRQASLIWLEA